nr:5'-nucleotidase C-terminal domain-containing protein [Xylanibacillus composti]
MLLFTNFFTLMPNQASAANGAMTVAEAIANNSGSGTVEGYIVGHATGSRTAKFTPPFANDFNFLIADSASERDLTKVLDVQVTAGYRAEFGLQTNPDLIGKKVRVSGSFQLYNNFPGLRSPTAMAWVVEETDPDVVSIADARAAADGETVVIRGVVTTPSGVYGKKSVYVQDDTAGILLYQDQIDLKPGDAVKVTGTKTTYANEVEIINPTIVITGADAVPAPIALTPATVTGNVYGQLVKLAGVTVSDIADVGAYGSYSFYANGSDGRILIYVDNRTGLTKDAVRNGLVVNITGVVIPYGGGLEIKPTGVNDIIPALADGTGKKVLFANTHGQTAGASDWIIDGGFSDFADGLRAEGFTVDQLERDYPFDFSEQAITLEKLQEYDVFILGEANIPFKTSEQDAMLAYVQGGGSIFFIGDHYNADRNYNRWDSTEVFNGYRRGAYGNPTKGMSAEEASSGAMQDVTSTDWLGTHFGIRFRYNALGTIESGHIVVPPGDSFGITEGVRTVEMHAGGTLAILDPTIAKGLVYVPENPPAWGPAVDQGVYNGGGIDEGPFAAIAKVGAGKAAFIGDSSPVEDASPKYLREDSGATKTTYDGFLEEGDNSEFLLQTVKWLAIQEDYTSFEGLVELSPVTPLLDFENPADSTEPQTEPWTTPPAGYKWHDPTTFAPGSYGSGKEAPGPVVIPGVTSIGEARQYPVRTTLTVEGTITSKPGSWGGQAFYLQDETGGIYIYQTSNGYQPGQRVQVTGEVTLYNTELELANVSEITVLGTGTLPAPKVVDTVDDSNQGQVVKLEAVTITNIVRADSYGTLELRAVKGDVSTLVRIDNRTGVNYDTFTAQYTEGDVLDLAGVASIYNGTYQLKPRSADDIAFSDYGSDWIEVDLIGLNDLHGKIDQRYELDINGDGLVDGTYGGAEYWAAYVREVQAANPDTLFVGVGDLIGGSSPVSALFQDEPTVEILNALDMDVNTVGNHEFDRGVTELMRMVNGGDYPGDDVYREYAGMDFAQLAANVVWKSGDRAGETILPAYEIVEAAGQQIGFIGVVTEGAADMVMPAGIQDIVFTDPVDAINDAVGELQAQGIHAIIVLAHSAAEQDERGNITGESAAYVGQIDADVDVIFAAHNHAIVNGLVGDTLIVQASEYGKALSHVQLAIDPTTGDIVEKSADIIWVDNAQIEPDSEVRGILDYYEELVAPLLNEVVGVAAHEMEGGYGVKGEIGDNALGNLIADSMKWAMDSDFAMMNGGGIRDRLNAGDITYGELYNILPFNNVLMKLEVTGSELREIVNGQLSSYYGPDFSISGFKYTWDGSTAKVADITFPDGSAIDPDATYTLAVNNFMATSTGDKYKAIGQLGQNPVMGPEDLDGLVRFVKSFDGPIAYAAEGRISEVAVSGPVFGEVISIANAKLLADGTEVTVEGIVTIPPGAFGANNSFYLEDASGAIQVYTYANPGVSLGDQVKLKSKKDTYNGTLQLNGIAAFDIQGQVEPLPQIVIELDDTLAYELVMLRNVRVADISGVDGYGNFSFQAVSDDHVTRIYVDSRTGISHDSFTSAYAEGDLLHITGIAAPYRGDYELKPRMMRDFKAVHEVPDFGFVVGTPIFTNFAGEEVTALTPNGFVKAGVAITNRTSEDKQASLIAALYDANGSVRNISFVDKQIGAGDTVTLNAGFSLPENVEGHVVKVFVWDSFHSMQPLSEAVAFPEAG